MKKDITIVLKKAMHLDINWEYEELFKFINFAIKRGYKITFDENNDNWISIFKDKDALGCIWRKIPFGFFYMSQQSALSRISIEFDYIPWVLTKSFTKEIFSINEGLAMEVFNEYFNYSAFSISDLLYETNNRD